MQNGADAVYLGGSAFNARRFAGNFSDEELLWAIEYCHARGVSVNVTFNTLLFDKELPAALSYGRFLYEAGVDAAIVQDLGLVRLLRENLPGLVLHASTQMGICDLDGARIAHDMGLSRVVLAREMPLAAVKRVCKDAGTEVEVFGTRRHVHERFRGVPFFLHGRGTKRKPRHMCAALPQTHGFREKARETRTMR